ncbi:MAG: zf-HC2 domain-containing protein [Dehalococcoidia bacterium]
MRCDRARERLGEYIEGALTGKALLALEEHLQKCPDCRRELDGLKELDARLKQEVPKYWENIEPAPEFLARLKRIQLETPTSPTVTPAERFSALWGRHRTALAAGLAVSVVIVLALTIPMFMSTGGDDDERLITSEIPPQATFNGKADIDMPTAPPQVMGEKGAAGPAGAAGAAGMAGANDSMILSPSSGASGESAKVTGSGFATPSATIPPAMTPEPPSFNGSVTLDSLAAKQEALAKEIALQDEQVRAFLGGQKPLSIQVFSTPVTDFICNGITVVIEKENADPQEVFLYACVDLDKPEVIDVKFSPTRPVTEPTPPPSETPLP